MTFLISCTKEEKNHSFEFFNRHTVERQTVLTEQLSYIFALQSSRVSLMTNGFQLPCEHRAGGRGTTALE